MKSTQRNLFFKLLILVFISIPIVFSVQPVFAEWDLAVSQAKDFAPGQLEAHYLKHGDQFGGITQDQYLQGARALLDASPGGDVLEKIRLNGDIEHFRVSTGEFAVMTKRGRIRTYFKTDYTYWLRQ